MTYSFTHFIFATFLVLLFRDLLKDKKYFPKHFLIIILIGALLPDLDVILYFIFRNLGYEFYDIHRAFSHSLIFPFISFLIGILLINKDKIYSNTFIIFSIAILSHLILDFIVAGKIGLFFPFSDVKIGINLIGFLPEYLYNFVLPIIDTIVLVFIILWIDLKDLFIKR